MKNLVKLVAMMAFALGCNDLQAGNPDKNPLKDSTINGTQQQEANVPQVNVNQLNNVHQEVNVQPNPAGTLAALAALANRP